MEKEEIAKVLEKDKGSTLKDKIIKATDKDNPNFFEIDGVPTRVEPANYYLVPGSKAKSVYK